MFRRILPPSPDAHTYKHTVYNTHTHTHTHTHTIHDVISDSLAERSEVVHVWLAGLGRPWGNGRGTKCTPTMTWNEGFSLRAHMSLGGWEGDGSGLGTKKGGGVVGEGLLQCSCTHAWKGAASSWDVW